MPKLKGKTALFIIASKNFRDEEYQKPRKILEDEGANVVVASSSLSTSKGMLGLEVKPNILLKDVKVDDYDIVVFVGGSGSTEYWNDSIAHSIAKEAVNKGKLLGAICLAPVTLANAGVLTGKKATVFNSAVGDLKKKGVNYTGKDVEQDGKIITANGPASAQKFGETLVKAF